ncbi:NfeD family protein [Sinisalibacter lacisalsi]|uniref:NfeD-like C-terminal domain-containing protein n=1 Tax=Sinisalibacter lacisalsi TaxID=1526570 RepID=A0ABQ1QA36_9RHOB|nr:hypothetical protein [Sinisalibacter lacisalsi]GGD19617.1 hypothetical protein GCM10011358_00260 [Sinisalibacter lacisalsi]
MIWEIWWAWVAAGLVLAILELVAPGFFFVGFALGAVVVGVLVGLGVVLSLPWVLVIFAMVSLLAWIALRQIFGVRKGQRKVFHRDINED